MLMPLFSPRHFADDIFAVFTFRRHYAMPAATFRRHCHYDIISPFCHCCHAAATLSDAYQFSLPRQRFAQHCLTLFFMMTPLPPLI